MPVLDLNDDLGASLAHELTDKEPPEFLKEASWLQPGEGYDRDYALILVDTDGSEHRKYACHDAGNTLASMFYLERYGSNLNLAAAKTAAQVLSKTASIQGVEVPDSIDKLASASLSEEDQRDLIDERRVRYRPPVKPRPQAKTASSPFEKLAMVARNWEALSPIEKRATAVELGQLSPAFGMKLPEHVFRYSGSQLSEKFASHMRVRAMSARTPEGVGGYERLAKVAHVLDPNDVVELIYELDNRCGLRWAGGDAYGEKIADPFLAVFDTVKEAEFSWSHGGDSVSESQLRRFVLHPEAETIFTSTFTDELWLKLKSAPLETFKEMPDEHKILVSRMARQYSP